MTYKISVLRKSGQYVNGNKNKLNDIKLKNSTKYRIWDFILRNEFALIANVMPASDPKKTVGTEVSLPLCYITFPFNNTQLTTHKAATDPVKKALWLQTQAALTHGDCDLE